MKFLAVIAVCFSSLIAFASGPGEVGTEAPGIVLNNIQSNGAEAKESVRTRYGATKFAFVEFSSVTCGYCDVNLPVFNKIAQSTTATTTSRLVEIDRDEAAIRAYVASHKAVINFPVALDTSREAKNAYAITATPTSFIIDSHDKIIYSHVGTFDDADVAQILALLK